MNYSNNGVVAHTNPYAVFGHRTYSLRQYKPLVYAVLFFFIALTLKVAVGVKTTKLGYYSGRQMERSMALTMKRQELELELSVLLKEEELSRRASKRLGLSDMSSDQIIVLE